MSERLREREGDGWLGRNRVFPRLFTFGLDVVGAGMHQSSSSCVVDVRLFSPASPTLGTVTHTAVLGCERWCSLLSSQE